MSGYAVECQLPFRLLRCVCVCVCPPALAMAVVANQLTHAFRHIHPPQTVEFWARMTKKGKVYREVRVCTLLQCLPSGVKHAGVLG